MPKYKFVAKNLQNKSIKDTIEARDELDLKRRLREKELVLVDFEDTDDINKPKYKLKANDLSEFSRQLSGMLESGITVIRAMGIILERDMKAGLKTVYAKLYKDVQSGLTLSEAMRQQSKSFPEIFINMYAAGEASGQLEQSAKKMAVHFEKEHRLNRKIKSAMTYPIILLVATFVVVMIIFIFILPEFFTLFQDMELPALTIFVIAMSEFLQSYWYYVVIGILLLIAFLTYLNTIPPVNVWANRKKLGIPKIGKLLKVIYTARFSRTLSSLYSGGLSMLNALDISSKVLGNSYIHQQFDAVITKVRNGDPLSEAVEAVDGFDKKLTSTILIGEESGRLDTMLESIAENFDYEAEMATQQMVALIEPVMIVLMAVLIGGVMLSVMLPILSLYQNIA